MLSVKIRNFQSIKKADLEIAGFTALVGKSNIGKSAIIRAVQTALENWSVKSTVKNGEKSCEVSLEVDTRNAINLTKEKTGQGIYQIVRDGETKKFEKLGRDIPPDIVKMGFSNVKLDNGEEINVQVGQQFAGPFLVSNSRMSVIQLLTQLDELQRLQKATRVCLLDIKRTGNEIREFQKRDKVLGEELEKLQGLDEAEQVIKSLSSKKETLAKKKSIVEKLSVFIAGLVRIRSAKEEIEKKLKKHLDLDLEGKIQKLILLSEKFKKVKFLEESLEKRGKLKSSVTSLTRISKELNLTPLSEKITSLNETREILSRVTKVIVLRKRHQQIDKDSRDLKLVIAGLKPETLGIRLDGLEKLRADVTNLKSLEVKRRSAKLLFAASLKKLDETAELEEGTKKNLTEILKEVKICPVCEREFDLTCISNCRQEA